VKKAANADPETPTPLALEAPDGSVKLLTVKSATTYSMLYVVDELQNPSALTVPSNESGAVAAAVAVAAVTTHTPSLPCASQIIIIIIFLVIDKIFIRGGGGGGGIYRQRDSSRTL
jgi:hypothetical protein